MIIIFINNVDVLCRLLDGPGTGIMVPCAVAVITSEFQSDFLCFVRLTYVGLSICIWVWLYIIRMHFSYSIPTVSMVAVLLYMAGCNFGGRLRLDPSPCFL